MLSGCNNLLASSRKRQQALFSVVPARQGWCNWQEPETDDESIQLEVMEYPKAEGAWQATLRHQFDYPLHDKLNAWFKNLVCCAADGSGWRTRTEDAASKAGQPFQDLPDDVAGMYVESNELIAKALITMRVPNFETTPKYQMRIREQQLEVPR